MKGSALALAAMLMSTAASAGTVGRDPRMALGYQHLQGRRWAMALDAFQAVLEERPDAPRATAGIGVALAGLGRCADALPLLGAVRGGRTWRAIHARAEADCVAALGDPAAAVAIYEEALAMDVGDAPSWIGLGRSLLALGDAEGARAAEEELAALTRPQFRPTTLSVAIALETDQGFDAELASLVAEAPGLPPWTRSELLVLDGQRWLDIGDPCLARDVFFRAVRLDLGSAPAAAGRAESLRRCGDPWAALSALDRPRVAGRPDLALTVIRARTLIDLGRLDDAGSRIAPLDPTRPEVASTAWWLAIARDDDVAARRWADRWEEVSDHPLRSLDQLRPVGADR